MGEGPWRHDEDLQTYHAELKAHTWHHYNIRGVLVRADQKGIMEIEGYFCQSNTKGTDHSLKPQPIDTDTEASVCHS